MSVLIVRKPYQVREAKPPACRTLTTCIHCGHPATKEALFKSGGFTIVEKYCDDCLKVERFTAIMTFYRIMK